MALYIISSKISLTDGDEVLLSDVLETDVRVNDEGTTEHSVKNRAD